MPTSLTALGLGFLLVYSSQASMLSQGSTKVGCDLSGSACGEFSSSATKGIGGGATTCSAGQAQVSATPIPESIITADCVSAPGFPSASGLRGVPSANITNDGGGTAQATPANGLIPPPFDGIFSAFSSTPTPPSIITTPTLAPFTMLSPLLQSLASSVASASGSTSPSAGDVEASSTAPASSIVTLSTSLSAGEDGTAAADSSAFSAAPGSISSAPPAMHPSAGAEGTRVHLVVSLAGVVVTGMEMWVL